MRGSLAQCILVLVLAEFARAAVFNSSIIHQTELIGDKDLSLNSTGKILTRRSSKKKNKSRSTSSSSERKYGYGSRDEGEGDESLQESSSSGSTSSSSSSKERKKLKKKKKYKIKSSKERTGWRKYHRKCTPCPADLRLKWRDPSISWICGAYQRARRSFKSSCMMHFRNCQDGTMFVKISDHRCANTTDDLPHGDHFFYDYRADLSDDSSDSDSDKSTTSDSSSTSMEWDTDKSRELKKLQNIG